MAMRSAPFTTAFASMSGRFGDGLSLRRDGDRVAWTFDGRTAIVELASDVARATFVDRPAPDAAARGRSAAIYRGEPAGYPLGAAGCARLADDLVAFFRGVREPRFAFVGLRSPKGSAIGDL